MGTTHAAVPPDRRASLLIGIMLVVAIAGPLIFGVPALGPNSYAAFDSNFALQLVRGYTASLEAHHWFPRWLPLANAGLGAPVFYFYGRLPFFVAALFAVGCHAGAPAALVLGLAAFRLLAFFTCRAWLRFHLSAAAADCGALLFIALPFAMTYNPIGRVGYAEVAATAFTPLLFLLLDRLTETPGSPARSAALLAVVYSLLAATHLPQTLLAIGAAALYGACIRGARGFLVNLAGAVCGLLLAAPNILPAMTMQSLITPEGWTGNPQVDIHSQFLFTAARLHLYHFLAQELYLYGTWLLCLLPLLALGVSRGARSRLQNRWARAVALCLAVCLLGMTKLFWPLWVYVPQMRALQFPWRLFPEAMAFGAATLAALVSRRDQARKWSLAAIAALIGTQVAGVTLGALLSRPGNPFTASVPAVVAYRLPQFVPWSERDTPINATQRSSAAEYLPAAARKAGWRFNSHETELLNTTQTVPRVPPSLTVTRTVGGDLLLRGTLPAPASALLPSFFFPGVEARGIPQSASVSLDTPSGLTRVALPAGSVALEIDHRGLTSRERQSHLAALAGILLFLGLVGYALAGPVASRRSRAVPGQR